MSSNHIYLPYVYKIVDKLTGEFYIGSRHQNVNLNKNPEEDFLKRYFSSGKFKKLIKEDPSRFEGSIIFRSGEPEAVYWYEQLLIKESSKNEFCANRHFIDPDDSSKSFCRAGKPAPNKGLHQSNELKMKRSMSMIGKNVGKRLGVSPTNKGVPKTEEQKRRQSEAQLGKTRIVKRLTCPHCSKEGGATIMKRWHFENCRMLTL